MEHELKCWPQFFKQHLDGTKPFELRRHDRPYAVGDVLVLNEYAPGTGYTGQKLRLNVLSMVGIPYAENLPWDKDAPAGPYVVLGTAPADAGGPDHRGLAQLRRHVARRMEAIVEEEGCLHLDDEGQGDTCSTVAPREVYRWCPGCAASMASMLLRLDNALIARAMTGQPQ